MLKFIALTTLVVLPILLLLLLQIQFLPFHDWKITNAQRAVLFLDIVFLWLLQPPILADMRIESSGRARVLARILRGFGLVLAGALSILALWFSIVVATVPGEWQETALAALDRPRWSITYVKDGKEKTEQVSTHDLLFAGGVNPITRRRDSPFSNTLVLPGFNFYEALKIDDPKKLAWKEHIFDLRARHLEQAVLFGANLTKTDLTVAQLQGASLYGVQLQGAELGYAQLQGAKLGYAQLQGASLKVAQLQGASLNQAELQGASLLYAQLQGALLNDAQLQGASLHYAQLQGASLLYAQLQGASLYGARLQGALLNDAQLQGASLYDAQLQGASLNGASFKATTFAGAFLWRTGWGKIEPADLEAVQFDATLKRWKPVWQERLSFDTRPLA